MRFLSLIFILLLAVSQSAFSQNSFVEQLEAAEDENGFIINFLQDQLSTESRKIRLSGVSGLLSSQARVGRITISDRQGVWLQIDNSMVDWSRTALFDGRVQVNSLSAETVTFRRLPVASGGIANAEATSFRVPDLPVSVGLDNLNIARLRIGEDVFGTAAIMALRGNLEIGSGNLAAGLQLSRLDDPGGEFSLQTSFRNDTEELSLDLSLQEPENGLVTSLASIQGFPALDLKVTGGGPLSDLQLDLDFAADGQSFLNGLLRMSGPQVDRQLLLDVNGDLSSLIAPQFQVFFDGNSRLVAGGRRKPDGGVALDRLDLTTNAMYLSGWLETAPDGFLSAMLLNGALASNDGSRVLLPSPDGDTYLQQADLRFQFDGLSGWGGNIKVDDLSIGDTIFGTTEFDLSGAVENGALPEQRRLTGQITGQFAEISSARREVARALGRVITVASNFDWRAGAPLKIERTRVSGDSLSFLASGEISDFGFNGDLSANITDLAAFSFLSGRQLAGAVRLETKGSIAPFSGGFTLDINGNSTDLTVGNVAVDALFSGQTKMSGSISRDHNGLNANKFQVVNQNVRVNLDGQFGKNDTDIRFRALVNDLQAVSENSSGAVTLAIRAKGAGNKVALNANITMPEGALSGREVDQLNVSLTGDIVGQREFDGKILGLGSVDSSPIFLKGALLLNDRFALLREFGFSFENTRMEGTLGKGADGLFSGNFSLFTPDLAPVSDLFLTSAKGAVDLKLEFSRALGAQKLRLKGSIRRLELLTLALQSSDIELEVVDLFGLPLVSGHVEGERLRIAGFGVNQFNAKSERTGQEMQMQADAVLENGTRIGMSGALTNLAPGIRLVLERLELANDTNRAALVDPAQIELIDNTLQLSNLKISAGNGSVTANGSVGARSDMQISAVSVPLDIANLIIDVPGIGGTVSGNGKISGDATQPNISFTATARQITIPELTALDVPPISVDITGSAVENLLNVTSEVTMQGGLSASLQGQIPMSLHDPALDLKVSLTEFPLPMIDRLADGQGLTGRVTGVSNLTGSLSDPRAVFDLKGNVATRALREAGVGAQNIEISGSYERFVVQLEQALMRGNSGIDLQGSGRIPFFGAGMQANFSGVIPLSLANISLADTGVQLAGNLDVTGAATGSLQAPNLSGRVALSGGTMVDPRRNVRIENLGIEAALSGTQVQISSASGRFSGGGRIEASGTIGLGRGFPSDVRIKIRDAGYTDGIAVDTTVSGDLHVTGPIAGAGRMTGELELGKTEISINQTFGIQEGVLLDIRHLRPPKDVKLTLARAGLPKKTRPEYSSGGFSLDLSVSAPNQIFIRGRGLDAEMGGFVVIRGRANDLKPIGRFEMRRGRISILGQRINFNDGWIALTGSFDPEIRLDAETHAQGTTVFLVVEGPVSDPVIRLSSSPELPQDEILSLLLFQQDLSELTPVQLLRLATAAAELAGKGGGFFNGLRNRIGLDDLEISAGEDGALGFRAGAYITEKLYLDVEADNSGDARATINLDVADHVRAKAGFGSDGESNIGIFYERDY